MGGRVEGKFVGVTFNSWFFRKKMRGANGSWAI